MANPRSSQREQPSSRWLALPSVLILVGLLAASVPGPARADPYDPKRAGHPLRIAAYVAYPVGVLLDYLIFRPAHWLAHRESVKPIVGHESYPRDQPEGAPEGPN